MTGFVDDGDVITSAGVSSRDRPCPCAWSRGSPDPNIAKAGAAGTVRPEPPVRPTGFPIGLPRLTPCVAHLPGITSAQGKIADGAQAREQPDGRFDEQVRRDHRGRRGSVARWPAGWLTRGDRLTLADIDAEGPSRHPAELAATGTSGAATCRRWCSMCATATRYARGGSARRRPGRSGHHRQQCRDRYRWSRGELEFEHWQQVFDINPDGRDARHGCRPIRGWSRRAVNHIVNIASLAGLVSKNPSWRPTVRRNTVWSV